MNEIRYHIEYYYGDLTRVVFEDGYTPYQLGRTITEAMNALREFRKTRPAHDLSVLRRRDYGTVKEIEVQPEPMPVEPKKRKSKRQVESEE